MPRGGKRPGAGRKKKAPATVLQHPSVPPPSTNYPPAPVEEFDAPDCLTAEERAVWMTQAPHAFRNGRLTKASALAFERYCRMVAREAVEAKSSAAEKPSHQKLRSDINKLELQFGLTPNGAPMPAPASEAAAPQAGSLSRFRR